jgi:zinc transporter
LKNNDGLILACLLDGQGGGHFGGWEIVSEEVPADGFLWVHLDLRSARAREWLEQESGLDEISRTALLAKASRPRALARGDRLLVNLRGVNLNPGSEPDDMIAVRVELEKKRVITTRRRHLKALKDIHRAINEERGPVDPGDFLIQLIDRVLRRMATAFEALDDRIDDVQERILTGASSALRSEIADIRNQVIAMRRYLAPQREAVARLQTEKVSWLTPVHREELHDLADRTTRRVEDLEAARDRATVAHEELSGRLAEQMNRAMYVLALVAAIFMPLGLITGLLGINVGGMPGAENRAAFWIVCALLAGLATAQWWWFRKRHLL